LEGYNNKDYPIKFGIFSHMVSEEKNFFIVKAAMLDYWGIVRYNFGSKQPKG
jgi:hypothetical protein